LYSAALSFACSEAESPARFASALNCAAEVLSSFPPDAIFPWTCNQRRQFFTPFFSIPFATAKTKTTFTDTQFQKNLPKKRERERIRTKTGKLSIDPAPEDLNKSKKNSALKLFLNLFFPLSKVPKNLCFETT
jgi:hypothetical protein